MFTLSIAASGIGTLPSRAVSSIMRRFSQQAGDLIVGSIRHLLGTDAVFHLQPGYAAEKAAGKTHPAMRTYSGKDFGQPLILSGSLYEGIAFHRDGDSVVIEVDAGAGVSQNGDDYAERWEERAHYLEAGLDAVEDQLAELLLVIIFEEMGLG